MLLDRFRNLALTVIFKGDPGKRDRERRLVVLLRGLLARTPGFAGVVEVNGDTLSVGKSVIRGGPVLLSQSAPRIDPVDWTRIRDKAQAKGYRIHGRFELLAYSRYDWIDEAAPIADIKQWLQSSDFVRVWVVECVSKRVVARIER